LAASRSIIRDQRDRPDVQEVVLMLADFSFTPPEQILAGLKKRCRAWATPHPPAAWGAKGAGMAMNAAKPDLNDVTYDAFLANDRLGDPEVIRVEPGGRVLLRIINSSSMSAFHIDFGEINGELTAVGRFAVVPVAAGAFHATTKNLEQAAHRGDFVRSVGPPAA
jgi:hypothetical protein